MRRVLVTITALVALCGPGFAQSGMSLEQAIRAAVANNPRVGESAANRRATDMEMRQVQGGLLPQVRVQGEYGSERYRRYDGLQSANLNEWRKGGGEAGIVINQLLFDGFASINQIYKQMARSDAAAWRVLERAELVALDTAESFLDILRFSSSIRHSETNLAVHERLNGVIQTRQQGGRAGIGDAQQVRERLEAAKAVRAEMMIRLEEAKAAFRRAVGKDPSRLGGASRLSGLPVSRKDALEKAIAANPTLLAAASDVVASERDFDASAGTYAPRVSLEARSTVGRDSSNRVGAFDDHSAKVRMDWMLFSGGTDSARREELMERVTEARMRADSLRRSAFESIDRAWGVRANSGARVTSLQAQVRAAQQVVAAYQGEFELGQRTLLDLLNAQNALFNAELSLEAARAVAVFADYQLLAATGQLLAKLNVPRPGEANRLGEGQRGVLPTSMPLPRPMLGNN